MTKFDFYKKYKKGFDIIAQLDKEGGFPQRDYVNIYESGRPAPISWTDWTIELSRERQRMFEEMPISFSCLVEHGFLKVCRSEKLKDIEVRLPWYNSIYIYDDIQIDYWTYDRMPEEKKALVTKKDTETITIKRNYYQPNYDAINAYLAEAETFAKEGQCELTEIQDVMKSYQREIAALRLKARNLRNKYAW